MKTNSTLQKAGAACQQQIYSHLRSIASNYFNEHPDAKDEIIKAFFAYHTYHPRHHEGAHYFEGPHHTCWCLWCGRSREMVRWDDLPAQCQKRPELPDIADMIRSEEEKAFALVDKATREVPKLVAKLGMSGETLAILHHTHGYDPETVDSVVNVPPQIMADYHVAMKKAKALSYADTMAKRKVVTVRLRADLHRLFGDTKR